MSTRVYRIEVTHWPTDDGKPWSRFYGPGAAVPDNEVPGWLQALVDAAMPLIRAYRDPTPLGRVAAHIRWDDDRDEFHGVLLPKPKRVNYLSASGVNELARQHASVRGCGHSPPVAAGCVVLMTALTDARDQCTLPWFGGLTVDHLYADCPSRMRGEKTLREFNWWGLSGPALDPHGTDVCGLCVRRHNREQHPDEPAADEGPGLFEEGS